jgi:ActR/RegA family two-component response regulator
MLEDGQDNFKWDVTMHGLCSAPCCAFEHAFLGRGMTMTSTPRRQRYIAAYTASGCARPIVFITGRGDIPTSVRAMKAGAVDFLTKPVDDEDLLAAVGTCSPGRAGRVQTTAGDPHAART